MSRGYEVILKAATSADAWAFVERICGVCTGVHALALRARSRGRAGIHIPENANMIRN